MKSFSRRNWQEKGEESVREGFTEELTFCETSMPSESKHYLLFFFTCGIWHRWKILGSGRSLGEGNGNPLQYFCLENPMVRGHWQATVHGVVRVGHDLATTPPPSQMTGHIELS